MDMIGLDDQWQPHLVFIDLSRGIKLLLCCCLIEATFNPPHTSHHQLSISGPYCTVQAVVNVERFRHSLKSHRRPTFANVSSIPLWSSSALLSILGVSWHFIVRSHTCGKCKLDLVRCHLHLGFHEDKSYKLK